MRKRRIVRRIFSALIAVSTLLAVAISPVGAASASGAVHRERPMTLKQRRVLVARDQPARSGVVAGHAGRTTVSGRRPATAAPPHVQRRTAGASNVLPAN